MFAALFLPDQMLLIRILAAFLTALAVVLACGSEVPRDLKVPGREGRGSRSAKTARKATC